MPRAAFLADIIGQYRRPRPGSAAYWVAAAVPAALLALFLASVRWPTYRRLAREGVRTEGVVTSTGCESRSRFAFVFTAGDRTWAGRGRAWRVGVPCVELAPGRAVPVYYLPSNPTQYAATADPRALARQELLIVAVAGLVCLLGDALVLLIAARRARVDAPPATPTAR